MQTWTAPTVVSLHSDHAEAVTVKPEAEAPTLDALQLLSTVFDINGGQITPHPQGSGVQLELHRRTRPKRPKEYQHLRPTSRVSRRTPDHQWQNHRDVGRVDVGNGGQLEWQWAAVPKPIHVTGGVGVAVGQQNIGDVAHHR